ncbi:MAG: sulfotransferase [Candidatus Omnitrophica bacterium]|nr:sulfotransferase [Candidatus Omnitrophota bacterium]
MDEKKVDKPPIFVLGCQRSGTTLLRRIIDSHPNIACPPESSFLVQLVRVYEIERARTGLETMGFAESDILNEMRSFAEKFFTGYREKKGKPRWADKTCPYLNHVQTIDAMFQKQAVYIGLVRHGLDVAYSLSELKLGVLKPYIEEGLDIEIAAIKFWNDQNKKLINFKNQVENRMHLIKYEDLTTQPEKVLPSVFSFLDEPWDDSILDYKTFDHDTGFEDPKIEDYNKIQPNSGNYKKWPLNIQKRLYQEALSMFKRFEYEL